MSATFIPVNEPELGGNEKKYLSECIDTGWISSDGPFVERFEHEMASCAGRSHGVAVANGSVALDAAVVALGIGPGDEVILPTFTIISCAAAVIRCGATPVLVDCDPFTWNMDPSAVEARITLRTRAIMVVHIYGLPADMAPILEIAERYGLRVIEDAAEMIGQTYRGRPCGSFGDVSTLSFYPNKHVTTGEGGMLLLDDDDLAARCRSLRNLCFQPGRRFVHDELGWNFRMSNIQAAVGVAQLEKLTKAVEKKRNIGARYNELLTDQEQIQRPLATTAYADNIYWVYAVVLEDSVPFDGAEAIIRMGERGIGCRPFFWPMHEQPALKRMGLFSNERHPVSERAARRGFYLPSGLALTDDQMERSAGALREILS